MLGNFIKHDVSENDTSNHKNIADLENEIKKLKIDHAYKLNLKDQEIEQLRLKYDNLHN